MRRVPALSISSSVGRWSGTWPEARAFAKVGAAFRNGVPLPRRPL
ncbi:Uncharacterised protein [Mycobacteroides abscessus subsp. abscessus]|nr:Uncharacterised protein [Mycobacteroides abscessus subsp. abscessus]